MNFQTLFAVQVTDSQSRTPVAARETEFAHLQSPLNKVAVNSRAMGMPHPDVPLGIGIYSFADAARFVNASAADLRRWAHGYAFKQRDGTSGRSASLLAAPQLRGSGVDGVGFRDLLELRFIKAFRDHGVSMPAVRQAAHNAKEVLGSEHPFTNRRFKTDGRSIFISIYDDSGDESLVDIVKKQNVFKSIITPSLYTGIDFDDDEGALRWYPVPRSRSIVLDPARVFGQPIIAESGVPTAALADMLKAEDGDAERVARIFEVPRDAVLKAQQFESRFARLQ